VSDHRERLVRCRSGHEVEAGHAYAAVEPGGRRLYACAGACARLWIDGRPGLRGVQAAHVVLLEDELEAARQGELALEAGGR